MLWPLSAETLRRLQVVHVKLLCNTMCRICCFSGVSSTMTTNLALDDSLINEALRLGKHRTKKAAVTAALQEYIQRHQRLLSLQYLGAIDFHPDADYKQERRRR